MSSPPSTRSEDCIDSPRVDALRLNASALSDSNSLTLVLTSELVSDPFLALVDSGSSNCFADSKFVTSSELSVRPIDPIPLTLIDGTVNNYVTQIVTIPT